MKKIIICDKLNEHNLLKEYFKENSKAILFDYEFMSLDNLYTKYHFKFNSNLSLYYHLDKALRKKGLSNKKIYQSPIFLSSLNNLILKINLFSLDHTKLAIDNELSLILDSLIEKCKYGLKLFHKQYENKEIIISYYRNIDSYEDNYFINKYPKIKRINPTLSKESKLFRNKYLNPKFLIKNLINKLNTSNHHDYDLICLDENYYSLLKFHFHKDFNKSSEIVIKTDHSLNIILEKLILNYEKKASELLLLLDNYLFNKDCLEFYKSNFTKDTIISEIYDLKEYVKLLFNFLKIQEIKEEYLIIIKNYLETNSDYLKKEYLNILAADLAKLDFNLNENKNTIHNFNSLDYSKKKLVIIGANLDNFPAVNKDPFFADDLIYDDKQIAEKLSYYKNNYELLKTYEEIYFYEAHMDFSANEIIPSTIISDFNDQKLQVNFIKDDINTSRLDQALEIKLSREVIAKKLQKNNDKISFSISAIEDYLESNFNFYLKYLLKLSNRYNFNKDNISLGMIFHSYLEKGDLKLEEDIKDLKEKYPAYHKTIDVLKEIMINRVREMKLKLSELDHYFKDPAKYEYKIENYCFKEDQNFYLYEKDGLLDVADSALISYDKKRSFNFSEYYFNAKIDYLRQDEKQLLIIDFKSSNHKLTKSDIIENNSLQLFFYALIASYELEKEIAGVYYLNLKNDSNKAEIMKTSSSKDYLFILGSIDNKPNFNFNGLNFKEEFSEIKKLSTKFTKEEIKKDDNLKENDDDLVTYLKYYTFKKIDEAINGILASEFRINPADYKTENYTLSELLQKGIYN